MRIPNTPQYLPDALDGRQPELLFSTGQRPKGDAFPWKEAQVGSVNFARLTENHTEISVKTHNSGRDSDWHVQEGVIAKRLVKADFTDVTTTGTYIFTETIPLGATVDYSFVKDVAAFSGDTSATITIGDSGGGADVDRYNTGTPSVFANITFLAVGAPSGTAYHAAAKAPAIIVTVATDFTATAATSALTMGVHYRM